MSTFVTFALIVSSKDECSRPALKESRMPYESLMYGYITGRERHHVISGPASGPTPMRPVQAFRYQPCEYYDRPNVAFSMKQSNEVIQRVLSPVSLFPA